MTLAKGIVMQNPIRSALALIVILLACNVGLIAILADRPARTHLGGRAVKQFGIGLGGALTVLSAGLVLLLG